MWIAASLRGHVQAGVLTSAALAALLGGAAPGVAAPSGPVAAYSFDAAAGGTVADVSGHGHTGTISGATATGDGRYGGALAFDGVDDWVTVADDDGLDVTGAVTIEAWVKPRVLGASWRTVVLKEQPRHMVYALYAHSASRGPSGHVYSSGDRYARASTLLPASSWTHLAVTYDGSMVRLYRNGSQIAARTSAGQIAVSGGALRIGGNAVWGEWFNGVIDEVRLYSRALTGDEIRSDMTTPITAGTPPPPAPSFSLPTMTGDKLYTGAGSPWNTPIPAGAGTDPASSSMAAAFRDSVASKGWVVAVKRWTVPVYRADATTPRYDVRLTASWRAADWMLSVPIPAEAAPDSAGDGHMAIFDPQTSCQYDFYEAVKGTSGWSAAWANSLRFDGTGVYPKGLSARGSGFATTAGLIWPEELRQGEIRHALLFSFLTTKAGGPVAPATESDGWSSDAGAIPEGARLQLDPSLDLDALGLNAYEKTIARALQRYGMILGDTGGSPTLYAINPQSFGSNPYASIWGDQTYVDLGKLPAGRFRVLALPPQEAGSWSLVDGGCAKMQ
jgi:hypothetical protein